MWWISNISYTTTATTKEFCDCSGKMSARTTAKYVKEMDRSRRRPEHLWLQPYVVLRRADISKAIRPKQEEPDRTRIKEEDVGKEVHHFNEQMQQKFLCTIKEEEEPERPCQKEDGEDSCDIKKEEEDTCEMPLTGVLVKRLDEAQHEVSKGAEPPSCSSSPHRTREGDGDHCGASRAASPSDSDDVLSHVTADDDDDSQNKHRQCSHCGIFFAHSSRLKQHMKMHRRKKNFSCSDCGQKFSQSGSLTMHTRIHTGEKPFSCSVCGQKFSRRGSLNRHARIHTGEKPFSCSVCGQMFSQRGHLNSHTLTHTGEKPF
ncbi:zinc finger protein 2-like, partial [Syngnathus acus]|uniref:zinc finger protein 2-like n=1 Tax=Syngnathus acus TaxID=161584 RepID=UPI00188623B6